MNTTIIFTLAIENICRDNFTCRLKNHIGQSHSTYFYRNKRGIPVISVKILLVVPLHKKLSNFA